MFENFRVMIIGGFYYGIYYIIGSLIITALLNKVFNKLYLPPLIINFVSVILLLIAYKLKMKNMGFALYFNYIPVVLTSIIYNFLLFIKRKCEGRI